MSLNASTPITFHRHTLVILANTTVTIFICTESRNVTSSVSDYTWSYTWSYKGLIRETLTDSHPAESQENKQVPSNAQ